MDAIRLKRIERRLVDAEYCIDVLREQNTALAKKVQQLEQINQRRASQIEPRYSTLGRKLGEPGST